MGFDEIAINEHDDIINIMNENSDFRLINEPEIVFSELSRKAALNDASTPVDGTGNAHKNLFTISLDELEK